MVRAAWSAGCPALLQRADHLLQRDSSVDGVLVAYGSQHVARQYRGTLAREAARVLRPRGVLVLHDFLVGSPMEEWFATVVDWYSRTGHCYPHFTREEIEGYLTGAGLEREAVEIDDPYAATGPTAQEAERRLGRYLLDMYGLVLQRQFRGGGRVVGSGLGGLGVGVVGARWTRPRGVGVGGCGAGSVRRAGVGSPVA
jgi:SAM-dependent methyltransferase